MKHRDEPPRVASDEIRAPERCIGIAPAEPCATNAAVVYPAPRCAPCHKAFVASLPPEVHGVQLDPLPPWARTEDTPTRADRLIAEMENDCRAPCVALQGSHLVPARCNRPLGHEGLHGHDGMLSPPTSSAPPTPENHGQPSGDLDAWRKLSAEAKGRADKATPGPWRAGAVQKDRVFVPYAGALEGPNGERVILRMNEHFPHEDDARFVAGSRTDVPALCDALDAAIKVIEAERRFFEGERRRIEGLDQQNRELHQGIAKAKQRARILEDGAAEAKEAIERLTRERDDNALALRVATNVQEQLAADVERLRNALLWFADEGHYEGTYRRGAGFVDAVGLSQARESLGLPIEREDGSHPIPLAEALAARGGAS